MVTCGWGAAALSPPKWRCTVPDSSCASAAVTTSGAIGYARPPGGATRQAACQPRRGATASWWRRLKARENRPNVAWWRSTASASTFRFSPCGLQNIRPQLVVEALLVRRAVPRPAPRRSVGSLVDGRPSPRRQPAGDCMLSGYEVPDWYLDIPHSEMQQRWVNGISRPSRRSAPKTSACCGSSMPG